MRLRALAPLAVVLAALVVLAVWGGGSSGWWPVLSGRPPAAERSPGGPGPAQSVREPPADAAGALATSRPAARPTATPVPTATPRPTPTPVPVVLRGRVVAADTGEAVAGALIGAAETQAATRTDAEGTFTATVPAAAGRIAVSAPGFRDESLAVSAGTAATVALAPSGVRGTVEDAFTGRPLGGVAVTGESTRQTRTDADGMFRLGDAASPTVSVSAGAYEPASIRPASRPQRVRLTPREVRGVYLTFFGVGDRGLRENALALIARSEVNAVVVDIKGDRGWIAYRSEVPLAERIGAVKQITIPDARAFLKQVHERGGLAIARIVVFKDDPLARARPDLAVRDARAGGPWVAGEGRAGTDPFRPEVWEYNVALAVEAARLGFD
ncbi:MAG: carboxypeptidase regulatory-like domain-containing protein, partial [Chloroflexi bacterium]|nr:carboxypeptidase regulatory-like domain-containing protein [Chloroflexota bacterium]